MEPRYITMVILALVAVSIAPFYWRARKKKSAAKPRSVLSQMK